MIRNLDIQRIFNLVAPLVIILAWSCAHPVAPTGGPKDETPPVVVVSNPDNRSVRFDKNQVQLTFNEYVQLKNTNEQVIISPPFTEAPEFRMKGKSVNMNFNEALRENTTYTIFFGEAITDITENNPLSNYWFVFSTGTSLDSMSLSGKVLNAFTLKPEEKVFVMLYDTVADSVVYKQRPYYVSRTDKEGVFHFYNLRDLDYTIFALKETNGNYLYDAGDEHIAFSDTLVKPNYIPISMELDLTDTLVVQAPEVGDLKLFMFQEVDSSQRLLENKLLAQGMIRLSFRMPLKKPEIKLLDTVIDNRWYLHEWNEKGDTLLMWLEEGVADTLFIEMSDQSVIIDTVRLLTKPVVKDVKSRKDQGVDKLKLTTNMKGAKLDPFNPLIISFDSPLKQYDVSGLVLYTSQDTLYPQADFVDTLYRKLSVPYPWNESTGYTLVIPDSVFVAMNGYSHDSLRISFSTRGMDDYGNLILSVQTADTSIHHIVQLVKEDETVMAQRIITGRATEKIEFINLDPGKYRIKVIFDRNANGQWDPGVYSKRSAPEKVLYFDKTLEIRSNWISEESWEF